MSYEAQRSKFADFLNAKSLLNTERQMWYRLGFYISAEAVRYDVRRDMNMCLLTDMVLNEVPLSPVIATNLRSSLASWWEGEKKSPRHKEINKPALVTPFDDGLSGLEGRNTGE